MRESTLYAGRSVLVLGLGLSGKAAVRFLLKRGARVAGVDQHVDMLRKNPEMEQLQKLGLSLLLESEVELSDVDLMVVSPGISPLHPLYQRAQLEKKELIGEAELAFRSLQGPCLAITGSNGKTSTVLLTEHVLNQSGVPAKALGNVGTPLCAAIDELKGEVVVAELSSWQLETMLSRAIDAGVILNITPNHLDRHGCMDVYAAAKLRLRSCLKKNAPFYIGMKASREFAHLRGNDCSLTFGYEADTDLHCDGETVWLRGKKEFKLPRFYRGKKSHEIENMMASYALCREVGITARQFLKAFATFQKPPHRIEFVRKIGGVSYYDDSKGSNVDAVIKAVASLKGPVLLIGGGVHKGARYTPWLDVFTGKVPFVCAIGQAADLIKKDIGEIIPVFIFSTLQAAVQFCVQHALPGDNVLLSPGCASFDMFCDYKHRGEEFKRVIHELKNMRSRRKYRL